MELNNIKKVDTKNSDGGLVTAEITLDNEMVTSDLKKIDETKYELKLVPKQLGEYKIHMFLNNQPVKGSPFSVRINSLNGKKISRNISFNKILEKKMKNSESKDFVQYSAQNLKNNVFDLSNRNEDLIVGEEIKLNGKIL